MPNVVDLQIRNEIDTEASAWIVQLHGKKPTREDLRALHEWMRRSPYHREAILRLAAVWDEANALTELLDQLAQKLDAPKPRGFGFPAFAAGLAALALAAFWAYSTLVAPFQPATYETALGQQAPIALSDGSTVLLNTDSLARSEYTRSARIVRLQRGEALFTVAKDASRPFRVYAGDSVIEAVGTEFAVRVDGAAVAVTVSEGVVEVAAARLAGAGAADRRRVTAGQMAEFGPGAAAQLRSLDGDALSRSLAWRDGVLVFKGETLDQVVAEVSRYTAAQFVFANPDLKSVRIGGYFAVGEVDGLLVALEGSFGVDVRRDEQGRIVLAGGDIK